jgi:hypothetical protein
MTHDYHGGLPGYSAAQILHDGCGECEARGEHAWDAIARLDHGSFNRAWERAAAWNKTGLPDISGAEANVLRTLWTVQLQLERRGVPIGTVPHGAPLEYLTALGDVL